MLLYWRVLGWVDARRVKCTWRSTEIERRLETPHQCRQVQWQDKDRFLLFRAKGACRRHLHCGHVFWWGCFSSRRRLPSSLGRASEAEFRFPLVATHIRGTQTDFSSSPQFHSSKLCVLHCIIDSECYAAQAVLGSFLTGSSSLAVRNREELYRQAAPVLECVRPDAKARDIAEKLHRYHYPQ